VIVPGLTKRLTVQHREAPVIKTGQHTLVQHRF
jgi:hypothetical protein